MKIITVLDVTDVHSVAAALQRAANEVLNADALKRLINDVSGQDYQYIYPKSKAASAVGGVNIIVGGSGEVQDMTTLYVSLKRPGGYNRESAAHYVPPAVIARLRIRLDGGKLFQPHLFKLDGLNNEARATLRLPTQTFRRYPNAIIQVV